MNLPTTPSAGQTAQHRVEFFRLPQPGKRDAYFGLSRGWYYKAEATGEIKMVAVRHRGALRGVRLIAYDSVVDYIRRSMDKTTTNAAPGHNLPRNEAEQLTLLPARFLRQGEARA